MIYTVNENKTFILSYSLVFNYDCYFYAPESKIKKTSDLYNNATSLTLMQKIDLALCSEQVASVHFC